MVEAMSDSRPTQGVRLVLRLVLALVLALAGAGLPLAARAADDQDVRTAWRLLDYIAVDYPVAVARGEVINPQEYAEMVEFSRSIEARLAALPASPGRAALVAQAKTFSAAVAAKQDSRRIAAAARKLAGDLLEAYPVALAPAQIPDMQRGAMLYAAQCAACHGVRGDGKGPSAAALDPPPVAFTDADRARERSVFALYQVIDQGIDGTAMRSFAELPAQDRWALAFHVSQFALDRPQEGEALWRDDPAVRREIPDLAALTGMTPAALGSAVGDAKAQAVLAYLRRHPEATLAAAPGSLTLARDRLKQSLAAYRQGDRKGAAKLALSAYLDGFEPVEPVLASRNAELMARIEREMGRVRAAIDRGEPSAELGARISALDAAFTEAEALLAPGAGDAASSFLGALTILLREGLEAVLVVVAMLAFLRKAERPELVRYVHRGWIAALAAGGATWAIATYLIGISGAGRELTEGYGSLFAAVVLLTVGVWMHGKSQAGEWQRYIDRTLGRALSKKSTWFLFGLSFLVVYREVFETILFYAALTVQGNGGAVLAGAAVAAALLAALTWLMLRFSARLPVRQFFKYSSALIAVLAVILAGKGVGALQEAGVVGVWPLETLPRIAMLGIYPSWQPLAAQLLAFAAVLWGIWHNERKAARSRDANARA